MTEQQLEAAVKHAHRHYAPREGERLFCGAVYHNWFWELDRFDRVWLRRLEGSGVWEIIISDGENEVAAPCGYTLQEALRLGRALVEQEKK